MDPLTEAFTVPAVQDLAGPGSYQRGVAYSLDGRVSGSCSTGSRLEATVRGTMPYIVELWIAEGESRWSCTCPAAEDGSFCRHCVAVTLTLERDEPSDSPPAELSAGAAPAFGCGRETWMTLARTAGRTADRGVRRLGARLYDRASTDVVRELRRGGHR